MKTLLEFIEEMPLNEALVKLSVRDVELVYKSLESAVKPYQMVLKGTDKQVSQSLADMGVETNFKIVGTLNSSQLTSPDAKKAHSIKPVKIYAGLCLRANSYMPSKSVIYVGTTAGAHMGLKNWDWVPQNQLKQLRNEFSALRLKSTIAHELTHWIDDTLNNMHMTKAQLMAADEENPQKFLDYLKAGEKDVGLAPVEINAVVNQIALIRKKIGRKRYERLTWSELVSMHPALNGLNNSLGAAWRRKVFERLSREGLLTPNFKK